MAEGRVIRASVTQGFHCGGRHLCGSCCQPGGRRLRPLRSPSPVLSRPTQGTVDFSSLSNPIGGLGENETATVRVDVYNASGTLVWTNGRSDHGGAGDWQSQYLVTSSDGAPATWQLYINGAAVSSGAVG